MIVPLSFSSGLPQRIPMTDKYIQAVFLQTADEENGFTSIPVFVKKWLKQRFPDSENPRQAANDHVDKRNIFCSGCQDSMSCTVHTERERRERGYE
jgi:hypothetical protein